MSQRQPHPYIPLSHCRQVFPAVHGLAHPGMRATRRLLAARAIWEGMKKDVNSWCRDCQQCSHAKVHRQPTAALATIPVLQQRFSHVHIDLVGPLLASASGFPYVFTMADLGLRSAPKEESGVSSAELLYGSPLALPGQFIAAEEPPIADLLRQLRATGPLPTRPLPAPSPTPPPEALLSVLYVFVHRLAAAGPLAPQYAGPYLVVDRGPKTFKLQMGGKVEVISVDRLKTHLGTTIVLPAQPPHRGRPTALVDDCSYAAVITGGGTVEDGVKSANS